MVTDWNQIADTAVVVNAKRPAGAAIVDVAYVHAAIYDAINAIDRRYEPYAVTPAAPEHIERGGGRDVRLQSSAQSFSGAGIFSDGELRSVFGGNSRRKR